MTPENERMLGLLRGLGLPMRVSREGDAKRVEIDLPRDGFAEEA